MKKYLCFLFVVLSSVFAADDFSDFTYHLKVQGIGSTEHGTAVAVHAEGYGHFILTANHCVKDVDIAEITNEKLTTKAKVVFRDTELDFAILKATEVKKYTPLVDGDLKIGGKLVFCHYPRGIGPKTVAARIVAIKDANVNYFAHAEGFYHGSSGCPVFLPNGSVTGVALAGLGINGVMVEGEAVFLPSKRIFQSIKAYADAQDLKNAKAVVVDLVEKERF